MAEQIPHKPHILVLISEGGGGHKSASDSLKEILSNTYHVEVINLFRAFLYPLVSVGKLSGESFYNYFMQKNHYRLLKLLVAAGNYYMHFARKKIARLFEKYLKSQPRLPDLIISTIPIMNPGLLATAHRLNIPFFLVTTDLDTTTFVHGFDKVERELLQRFKMSLAYERPEIVLQVFKNSVLEPDDLVFTGFPVRPACQHEYTSEEIAQLKNHYGMSSGKKVITMIMGAVGGGSILEHTQEIAKLSPALCRTPIEANICVGRNQPMQTKIIDWLLEQGGWLLKQNENCTSIHMPQGIVLHIRGFTDELILIMACSDLIISKTGSCTVNEAIYLGKKILLDNTPLSTARYLQWEQFNVHFVKRHGLGAVFKQSQELASLIPFLLNHVQMPTKALKLPDFQTNITNLVSTILQAKSTCQND